jgi:hypothetical protein
MNSRDQVYIRYFEKLSNYHWNWFGTLTLPGRPSRHRAVRMVEEWIDNLEAAEGGRRFRWVRVRKPGADPDFDYGNPDEFRVLIGGLRSRTRTWEKHWEKLGGRDASLLPVEVYEDEDEDEEANEDKGPICELLRGIDADGKLDIRYHLK